MARKQKRTAAKIARGRGQDRASLNPYKVKAGEVWISNDPRRSVSVKIERVTLGKSAAKSFAEVVSIDSQRKSKIRLDRFRPEVTKGYRRAVATNAPDAVMDPGRPAVTPPTLGSASPEAEKAMEQMERETEPVRDSEAYSEGDPTRSTPPDDSESDEDPRAVGEAESEGTDGDE